MKIQMFRPVYDVEACLANIKDCLEKGWTGKGYKTIEFEEAWKKYTGMSNAHFLTTGTAGLNLAVETFKEECGWSDGDEVISTPLTFVATNNCILFNNLTPVFADVDETLCLSPESVKQRITDKTRAVIFVGIGGNTGHYHQIVDICRKHNIKLILDAAHMAGTRLNGEIPGKEADAVIYSFHVTKNLSTAESGMLCFKEKGFDEIVRNKSFNGISKPRYDEVVSADKDNYDVRYLADAYNGNSIIASIALAQLPLLDAENAKRREIAAMYDAKLSQIDELSFVNNPNDCVSARWLYQIIVKDNRNALMTYLRREGIECGVHYPINTLYPMYEHLSGTCPDAEYLSGHLLTLPLHILLTEEEINYIIDSIGRFFNDRS